MDYADDVAPDVLDVLANVVASVSVPGQQPVDVSGYFDVEYVETSGITGNRPTFTGLTDELGSANTDTYLMILDAEYRVAVVQPNGVGLTMLVLETQ